MKRLSQCADSYQLSVGLANRDQVIAAYVWSWQIGSVLGPDCNFRSGPKTVPDQCRRTTANAIPCWVASN